MRKHVVNPKDTILEMEKTSILYKNKCQDCDHVYIGETERTIQVRAKEHYENFRLGYEGQSSVADHAMDNGHRIA